MLILFFLLTLNINSSLHSLIIKQKSKIDYENGASSQAIDTIKYLQTVISQKDHYIDKELNFLMKDLSIKPQFFIYNFGGIDGNSDFTKSTALYFYFFKYDVSRQQLVSHQISGVLTVRW